MNLHRLTVKINGEKEILIVKDIISFLAAIDAQNGTLADSGMEQLDEKFDYLLQLCQQAKQEIKECGQMINERRQIRIDFENKVKELENKLNV